MVQGYYRKTVPKKVIKIMKGLKTKKALRQLGSFSFPSLSFISSTSFPPSFPPFFLWD
jgi:hypothetical protein